MKRSLLTKSSPYDPVERVPMHPEDYAALLEWIREKERRDTGRAEISS
ncbi:MULTISPECIES: hypothetical protein [unclassified Methanoregula]|nr:MULTISPECIES: hypothetical protein [unclassified Methanoregula]OPX63631.1 MAG: hypothetical protein A4E33_01566 [Methanoregula sp. PtaB.Bin085]OPY36203.1 MAG: hypothetical protein A4E34_00381 [Methanoregula sp. PtaU1.Bin006]